MCWIRYVYGAKWCNALNEMLKEIDNRSSKQTLFSAASSVDGW